MITINKLLDSNCDRKIGNHSVSINNDIRQFVYFNTMICAIDDREKVFMTDTGGWDTSSTKRAISSYEYRLRLLNYEKITKELFNFRKKI